MDFIILSPVDLNDGAHIYVFIQNNMQNVNLYARARANEKSARDF